MPDLPVSHAIPQTTASDSALAWVQACLKRCEEGHLSCKLPLQRDFDAPVRLLSLQTGDHGAIRLIEPATTSLAMQYACLSHCWGHNTHLLKTLSTNLQAHKTSIPISALPLTFAETVSFLRKLGIWYLWIDSLCIVQDDDFDWRQQSAQMASIYQNAQLVISASKASNAEDGLYSTVGPEFAMHTITYSPEDGSDETLCFRRSFTHIPNYLDQQFGLAAAFPTSGRAWIFQERFLSRRVLHFGFEELTWECLECTTCQCRDQDTLHTSKSTAVTPANGLSMGHISHPKSYFGMGALRSLEKGELQTRWHRLIEEYTKLNMSYEKDIFPAISGLAQSFESSLKMKYCAGIWEENFISDLLWYSQPIFKHKTSWSSRPKHWRAPTWSWASITSPAKYISDPRGFTPFCTMTDVKCVPSGQDPMGQLVSAEAYIHAHIIRTLFTYKTLNGQSSKSPWNLLDLAVARGRVTNVWADYDCSLQGANHLPPNSEILVLLLGEKTSSRALEALLLTPCDDSTGQGVRYERIGLVEFSRPPGLSGDGLGPWLKYLCCTSEELTMCIV